MSIVLIVAGLATMSIVANKVRTTVDNTLNGFGMFASSLMEGIGTFAQFSVIGVLEEGDEIDRLIMLAQLEDIELNGQTCPNWLFDSVSSCLYSENEEVTDAAMIVLAKLSQTK